MEILRIGGVPEHYNLPWHISIGKNAFASKGIDVKWIECPGGTGAMCKALRSGELDMAVLLTEGIIADIANGNDSKILQWYVTTPLIWGIHVSAHSDFKNIEEIKGKRYAISRVGSGSHLMAYVDASARRWKLSDSQFVQVGNLEGAVKALSDGKAEIFLWEKFMTKPFVDRGIFRRLGECPTPWPCFAIAANAQAIVNKEEAIIGVLEVVNSSFGQIMQKAEISNEISKKFQLTPEDATAWLQLTKWADGNKIERSELEKVVQALFSLDLIKERIGVEDLVSKFTVLG